MLPFIISAKEKQQLLDIARKSIQSHLLNNKFIQPEISNSTPLIKEQLGAFVSVYYKKELRGCIGRLQTEQPLYKTIADIAVSAAFNDRRFEPLPVDQLNEISLEISVLSSMQKIGSIDEIIPGKHGIYIKKEYRSGTYLPQVALRTGWNAEQMLSHCAQEKVGIGREGWRDAEIYIYEALVFSDKKQLG